MSENFIQILNFPSKCWILVIPGTFGQIHICDSLATNGSSFTGLLFNFVVQQQKNYVDCGIFTIAYVTEIFHDEKKEIRHSVSLKCVNNY